MNSAFAATRSLVLAVVMVGLASCDSARQNVEDIGNMPTGSQPVIAGTETNMNCELKNGPTGCEDMVNGQSSPPPQQTRIPLSQVPAASQPPVMESQPEVQAVSQSNVPAGVDLSAEGCVWKNRAYSAGESIYHTDGPLIASEIYIRGQTFSQLAGVSPDQRYQQCQCSSSSGHWGCV